MRHIAGVLIRPRSTMAALVAAPTWLTAWALLLVVWLVPAVWLLTTGVGRQALIDERVRQVEAFGGQVSDAEYDAWQQSPPWVAYFLSGGRLLLTPPVTLAVAAGLALLAKWDGVTLSAPAALSIGVHASTVLAVQQLVAMPLHYLRESLTSMTNLALFLPVEDGTAAARLFGAVDLFGLWWVWLLALGVSAATGRRPGRYLARMLGVYVGIAAALAAVILMSGGS
jgi:hypothetical protein